MPRDPKEPETPKASKPDLSERFDRAMRRLALVVTVSLIVLGALFLIRWLDGASEPREFRKADEVTELLMLPSKPLDASMVLGRSRSEVRALLGTPDSEGPSSDVFDVPPRITVRYVDGRAVSLGIYGRHAGQHLRQARKWLKLPTEGVITLGDRRYRAFSSEPNEVLVEEIPPEVEARIVTTTERRRKWSSLELLRSFPKIPSEFASECSTESAGAGALFCLSNADARLLYDLDGDRNARVVTVLDPPGANSSLDECRGFLKDAFPGAQLVAVVDEPGQSTQYFAHDGQRSAFVWTHPGPKSRAGCALMACQESEDPNSPTHSPCVPRG